MNKIVKNKTSEDINFNGYVAKAIKRGDVILRPIIPNSILDCFINWLLPGNFEHAMVYLGNGELLNPYPDDNMYIHQETLFNNFIWHPQFAQNPQLLTFARITDNKSIIEKTITRLKDKSNTDLKGAYCSSLIIKSFVYGGIPHADFEITKIKKHWLSSLAVRKFETGYEIAKAAVKLIKFKKIK